MYRKNNAVTLQDLMNNLKFMDVLEYTLMGRYPKISDNIEKSILKKIFTHKQTIKDMLGGDEAIYYRTTGGRYFKIITNYSTGSTKEKALLFDKKYVNIIGAILSSSLYFWFYQIYSNNLDLKSYEIESFTIPIEQLQDSMIQKLAYLYTQYLADIEKNVTVRYTKKYANIDSFKEYKIGKSKHLIDHIDDIICPLYGLNKKELVFIKNYDIDFRISDNPKSEVVKSINSFSEKSPDILKPILEC
ncbi:MAG: hypothetical protein KAH77_11380 [Thiomargarita sp.]|nr:hypothetical protein [Thiomargarita sp.]